MSKNKKIKTFLWPIFIKLLGHAVLRTAIYALSFAPNEKPRKAT